MSAAKMPVVLAWVRDPRNQSHDFDKVGTHDRGACWACTALKEIDAAHARIEDLERALRRHGRHSSAFGDDGSVLPPACGIYRQEPCTCGLDAALNASGNPTGSGHE